jgi:hypothetical protein
MKQASGVARQKMSPSLKKSAGNVFGGGSGQVWGGENMG